MAPFTLVKKSLALGGTAMTFLFGALIFTQNKEKPPVQPVPPVSTGTASNFPVKPPGPVPEPPKSTWASFLSGLFGGKPSNPAPVAAFPTVTSAPTSAAPAPPPPSAMTANVPAAAAPRSSDVDAKAAATPPRNEMWQQLHDKYQDQFHEAVKNGDSEAAQKYSRLMVEAKNKA